jgi:feruloyl esterase
MVRGPHDRKALFVELLMKTRYAEACSRAAPCWLLCGLVLVFCSHCFAATCESLATLAVPRGAVTIAETEQGSALAGLTPKPLMDLPPFCRVAATLSPAPDSHIKIEVWMPSYKKWNGKFKATGNSGYAGAIAYAALAEGLKQGYAIATTDMGSAPSTILDGDSQIGHPDKWLDWGARSTHEMTVAAKQIIGAYYGSSPHPSYFVGCSTGGEQGLMEAQRYPDDYDGIVAGAPANNRTRLHMEILWNFVVSERDPADQIPVQKLQWMTQAVLKACAQQKTVSSDAFLSEPMSCKWDPLALLCKSGETPECLTPQQVAAARSIYSGPVNSRTEISLYPGLERGSEAGWKLFEKPSERAPFDSLFKWAYGPGWNWHMFDFDRDVATIDARLSPVLNATNPDLTLFREHGHKLIVYHGLADPLVPPQESINYYKSVVAAATRAGGQGRRSAVEQTRTYYRLFLVPGMSHCSGGPGLNTFDGFPALENWVEKDIPPDSIVAARVDGISTGMSRPVCAYPQIARYHGAGNSGDATSFSCTPPAR